MPQKVMLCRVVWAEKYNSKKEKIFAANMRYPAAHGFAHEQLNFAVEDGATYGYVENRGQKIDIQKLGADADAEAVDGVIVIFCALDEPSMKLRVVGWYEDATVYKMQQRPKKGSIRQSWKYYFRASSHDAHLIPATSRDLEVPSKQKRTDKGFIGQRSVFYPSGNANYERFLQGFDLLMQDIHVAPDQTPDSEEYQEGQRTWHEISHSARNPKLVQAAKRRHGTVCQACGFDFAVRYGKLGEGYIEVHHKWQMADIGRRVSTVKDVDVLCANCHRMVHQTKVPLTLAELRKILAEHS
jgi:5-methylcytosine-specific restriction protein A